MKKILSILALDCSSAFAVEFIELECHSGVRKCTHDECVTIVFNNKTASQVHVDGLLDASLTGAAQFMNSKFHFSREFSPGETSCYVETGGMGKWTKSVKVVLRTKEGSCDIFLPKSAVMASDMYRANIESTNYCVISR